MWEKDSRDLWNAFELHLLFCSSHSASNCACILSLSSQKGRLIIIIAMAKWQTDETKCCLCQEVRSSEGSPVFFRIKPDSD